jgi:hypothetical protein
MHWITFIFGMVLDRSRMAIMARFYLDEYQNGRQYKGGIEPLPVWLLLLYCKGHIAIKAGQASHQ